MGVFEQNSSISSLDFINPSHFVSGSWDGKACVWSIPDHKVLRSYDNHKHAVTVFYNRATDEIVSGSQDKALNVWNWKTGQVVKRVESAHGDIVRDISAVDEVGFVTCSGKRQQVNMPPKMRCHAIFAGISTNTGRGRPRG